MCGLIISLNRVDFLNEKTHLNSLNIYTFLRHARHLRVVRDRLTTHTASLSHERNGAPNRMLSFMKYQY